jgi:hypothetical protein
VSAFPGAVLAEDIAVLLVASMLIRTGVIVLAILATLSVTAQAQTSCYLPDGHLYIGRQPPADCSPIRPKVRDEAIQRGRDATPPPAVEAPRLTPSSALPPGQGWTFKVYRVDTTMIRGEAYVRKTGESYWAPVATYLECEEQRRIVERTKGYLVLPSCQPAR